MRVIANREGCAGAGMCVMTAPEVFEQDEDGLVAVRIAQPPSDLHDAVREAVELCPSRSLRIEIESALGQRDEAKTG